MRGSFDSFSNKRTGFLIAFFFTFLIFSSFSLAVEIYVSTSNSEYDFGTSQIKFKTGIDLDYDERIPAKNLTFVIIGENNRSCVFYPNTTIIEGCTNMTIYKNETTNNSSYNNGSMFGYGYGRDPGSYNTTEDNKSFGIGYGYAYVSGSSWSNNNSELLYLIVWDPTGMPSGNYTADLEAYCENDNESWIYLTEDANDAGFSILEEEDESIGLVVENPQNTTYTSLPIPINVTTNISVSYCTWRIDGGEYTSLSGSGTEWYDEIESCDIGTHQFEVDCDNTTNNSVYFTYTIPPTYSQNSTNSTYAGTSIEHRLKWEDDSGLWGYIFSFCNGTWDGDSCSSGWENDTYYTWFELLSSRWTNITKTISSEIGLNYAWCFYVNDSSGNWNDSCSSPFTYQSTSSDPTPPTVTITNPSNTTYGSLPINLNITTNESADWCGWNLNNTSNTTLSGSGTSWYDTIDSSSEGSQNLYVYCNDSAGNMGSDSLVFTYDNTPPKYLSESVDDTCSGCSATFELNWTDGTGLSGYIFDFCNGSECYTYSENYQETEDVWYNPTMFPNPGNMHDGDWDTYSDLSPSYCANQYVYVNYTIPEDTLSVKWRMKYLPDSENNETIPESCLGGNELALRYGRTGAGFYGTIWECMGESGWVEVKRPSAANSSFIVIYEEGVYWNTTTAGVGWSNDTWVEMTGTSNTTSVTKTINSNIGSRIYWKVYANDTVGNWNTSSVYNFTVSDCTDPVVYLAPEQKTNTSLGYSWFNVTATDNFGMDTCTLYTNKTGTFQPNATLSVTNNTMTGVRLNLSEGIYIWNYLCVDTSGNSAWHGPMSFFITFDHSSPNVTIDYPNPSITLNSVPEINGVVTEAYLKNCTTNQASYSTTDSTSPFNFTNSSPIEETTHNITVTCYDYSGNSGHDSVTFTYDVTPPTVTITNPSNTTYGSLPINLNITTNESADWCGWNLNNTSNTTLSGSGTSWYDTIDSSSEGSQNLYVYCNDSAGNMGSDSLVFTYGAYSPKYESNSTNSTAAGKVSEFRLKWTDESSLSGYIFSFCNGGECDEIVYGIDYEENATSYDCDSGWDDYYSCAKVYDGDWDTYGMGEVTPSSDAQILINYTKPSNSIEATWEVKDSSSHTNYSVPETCFNQSEIKFKIISNRVSSPTGVTGYCWNGDSWYQIFRQSSSYGIYDEGVYWNVSSLGSGWSNDTWTEFSGNESWSNVTKTLNSTTGTQVYWKVYANNTYNSWNASLIYHLLTTDETNPVVSLSYPQNSAEFETGSVWFNVTVIDETGVDKCTLYTNTGGSWTSITTLNATNNTEIGTRLSLSEGDYRWNYLCNDTSGNEDWSNSNYTITIEDEGGGGGGGSSGGSSSDDEEEEEEDLRDRIRERIDKARGKAKGLIDKIKKRIPKALFDINGEITQEEITGDFMNAKITLINFGEPGLINATVHYKILGKNGEVLYDEIEIVPVETQKEFIKTFDISDYEEGEYTLLMDLEYEGQNEPAKSESVFKVERGGSTQEYLVTGTLVLAAFFVVIVAYMKRDEIFKKHEKKKKKH